MSVKVTAKFTCTGCGATATKTAACLWSIGAPKGWGAPDHMTRRGRRGESHFCPGCNRAAKAAVRSALDKRKPKRKR